MTKEEQKILLQLARKTIDYFSQTGSYLTVDELKIPFSLKKKHGNFVTLTINGELRGCIGYLDGQNELWQDIVHNAVAAGFEDPRFPPLTQGEISLIHIEISILSQPKMFDYATDDELLSYFRNNRPGVILKQGIRQATYLPQVWGDFSDPSEFLSSLCTKAGLPGWAWENHEAEIYIYTAEYFEEE